MISPLAADFSYRRERRERKEREEREKRERERDGTAAPLGPAYRREEEERRRKKKKKREREREESGQIAQPSPAQRDGSSQGQGVSGGRRTAHKHKRTGSPSREENKR